MGHIRSARWARRSALRGLNVLVVAVLGSWWGSSHTGRANASVHRDAALAAPRLISLTYGRYRPQGASHAYLALRLRALEPHGQVIATQVETSGGHAVVADGGCDIGGRRSGRVETFYLPLKLSSGVHEVTVTALGSACTAGMRTRTATRMFRIRSREPHTA